MSDFYVKTGDSVGFAKTVGETDIYLFAGITGDFSVNHVNEQYMAQSKYGRRIAHGALLVGYMSTCSTMMIDKCAGTAGDAHRRAIVARVGPRAISAGDLEAHLARIPRGRASGPRLRLHARAICAHGQPRLGGTWAPRSSSSV